MTFIFFEYSLTFAAVSDYICYIVTTHYISSVYKYLFIETRYFNWSLNRKRAINVLFDISFSAPMLIFAFKSFIYFCLSCCCLFSVVVLSSLWNAVTDFWCMMILGFKFMFVHLINCIKTTSCIHGDASRNICDLYHRLSADLAFLFQPPLMMRYKVKLKLILNFRRNLFSSLLKLKNKKILKSNIMKIWFIVYFLVLV